MVSACYFVLDKMCRQGNLREKGWKFCRDKRKRRYDLKRKGKDVKYEYASISRTKDTHFGTEKRKRLICTCRPGRLRRGGNGASRMQREVEKLRLRGTNKPVYSVSGYHIVLEEYQAQGCLGVENTSAGDSTGCFPMGCGCADAVPSAGKILQGASQLKPGVTARDFACFSCKRTHEDNRQGSIDIRKEKPDLA